MIRNKIIKYCLKLPNTYEDYPFPDDNVSITMKHKNNNKWFALLMNVKGEEYLNIKTKGCPFERQCFVTKYIVIGGKYNCYEVMECLLKDLYCFFSIMY